MLTALRIDNFLIVKHLELDFSAKMTAFTGETGAGKSIMIDALTLALGGRADASVIRKGQDKCEISATFFTEDTSEPAEWLRAHDIEFLEGEIILRRVLYKEGRSKSYVNGQPFPLQKLKELSDTLVHIHGQHQHQTLMLAATHRQQLDNYAGHAELITPVKHAFQQIESINNQLKRLSSQQVSNDRLSLLEFQIAELTALNLLENEPVELNKEHQLLYHAYDYLQRSEQIEGLLSQDEINISHSVNQILSLLKDLPQDNPWIKNAVDLINNALIQCDEATSEISRFKEKIQLDPERLQLVENRLSVLHQIARKYHVDTNQLTQLLANLVSERDALKMVDANLVQLQEQLSRYTEQYYKAAEALRVSRVNYADKLAEEINTIIRQLGMPQAELQVSISPLDKMHSHGMDKIEYKASTNAGTAPDLLNKIASGGELSRISLAIQVITAARGSTPTLMFDEVDVGIGGATAALVGRLLRKLGERLQVFCVTHQPQVAAHANQHFVVAKHINHQETFTEIIAVTEKEKIDEIARMLGGLTITDQTRINARELLEQSNI